MPRAYRGAMRPLRFRVVALIAAYGLALHALISAFAIAIPTVGAVHVAEICSTFGVDPDGAPLGDHDAACAMACAMLDGTVATPARPNTLAASVVLALVLLPVGDRLALQAGTNGLPQARAPPAA